MIRELGLDRSDFRISINNSDDLPKLLEYRNRELFRYQFSTRIRYPVSDRILNSLSSRYTVNLWSGTALQQTTKFETMLDCFDFEQTASGPKHKQVGHTLDIVLTRSKAVSLVVNMVYPPTLSDHSFITTYLDMNRPALPSSERITRACKKAGSLNFLYRFARQQVQVRGVDGWRTGRYGGIV